MSDFYEEACYLSNSEAEPDSETEDVFTTTISNRTTCQEKHIKKEEAVIKPELAWDDPQALLNTWLGELDNLNMVSDATSLCFGPVSCVTITGLWTGMNNG